MIWGIVTIIDSDNFWLDDGSGAPVKINAPGYADIDSGNYASAMGALDVGGSSPILISKASSVKKLK